MSGQGGILSSLARAGRWLEDALLVLILTGMILLAAAQIVLRNFFDVGFIWGDELLRMLVLWLAVAGAVAASRSDKHIAIELLNRYLPERGALAAKVVVHLFTAAVAGVMAWHSLAFVRTSWEFGDVLLGSVPAWIRITPDLAPRPHRAVPDWQATLENQLGCAFRVEVARARYQAPHPSLRTLRTHRASYPTRKNKT